MPSLTNPTRVASTDPSGLPERVRIWEVGARDGLQNEVSTVDLRVKAEFVNRLETAGLATIEATSFVHPKWVPQIYPVRVRPARRMVGVAARSSRAGSGELTPRREVSGFPHQRTQRQVSTFQRNARLAAEA